MLKRTFRTGTNLVELAVVIMILGVLFTGIFGAYYTSLKITKNVRPTGGTDRKSLLFAVEHVRKTFAQTFYIPGHKRIIFKGKGDGSPGERRDYVTFAAHHAGAEEAGMPAIREVSFYLKKMGEDGIYYYLIRREDEMVDKDPYRGVEHILLDHVSSFQLKYSVLERAGSIPGIRLR